ncbi:MAG: hypothetical protein DRH33_05860 [Candidatus Nealsonbacteria bacterium]|nr:MAG: hypothetical protein DRH33_05860 [Candidatus Nealsonbacteria bacterium]
MLLYTVIPKILGINTEVKKIRNFSFGESLRERTEKALIKLNFKIDNLIKKPSILNQKYHFFWGKHNHPCIYYERRIIGGLFAKMLFKNSEGSPSIIVNKPYLRWIRVRTNNIFPPGTHLTDIATVKLIEKSFTPLHCAGVSWDNKGILIFAPPNTGKTLTSILLVQNGFKFISEDISVSDGNEIYGCPFTSTFRYYDKLSSKSTRYLNLIATKIPFLAPFIEPKAKVIQDYVERDKIKEKASIFAIVVLERGGSKFKKLDENEAFRRILNINRYEFNYYRNPILRAYSYFNQELDLNSLMLREEKIIRKVITDKNIYLIRENNPEEYIKHFKNLKL